MMKVLLLNADESTINIVDWKIAVCLHFQKKAKEPWGYDDYYEIPSASGEYLLPTAMVLTQYVYIPFKLAAVNKKNVLRRDKYICGYCEKELTDKSGTVDHIIPTSRWEYFKSIGEAQGKAAHNWKNVIACCRNCNGKKDDKTPKEAKMKLKFHPFVPSKEYLVLSAVNQRTRDTWDRWLKNSSTV